MKLNQDDWKMLFPCKTCLIGTTKLEIKPLSLKDIPKIMVYSRDILEKIKGEDFSTKTFFKILLHVAESPEIISLMSGLDIEDVKNLPIDVFTSLATECIKINIGSGENLLKNLTALVENVTNILPMTTGILEG